ncbi:unnamed protein product [Linum tenue]|uniref:Secreted protein n=1 Tax=Linum tenue TaxID=586396 RepID=A0AAV0IRR5_9ROSI|nr:unnamed protein product [Linum tenue]
MSSIGSAGLRVFVFAIFWLRKRQIRSVKKRRTRYLFRPIDGPTTSRILWVGRKWRVIQYTPSCHSSTSMTFELLPTISLPLTSLEGEVLAPCTRGDY